jgi:hypothetical protein
MDLWELMNTGEFLEFYPIVSGYNNNVGDVQLFY